MEWKPIYAVIAVSLLLLGSGLTAMREVGIASQTEQLSTINATYKYECTQDHRVYEYTRPGSYKCPDHGTQLIELRGLNGSVSR